MNFEVSGSEKEILEYLWENPEGLIAREILSFFNENKNKNWKKQTLNTFLLRLTEKGLVDGDRSGAKRVYRAVFDKAGYEAKKAEKLLENFYQGSLSNFIMTLSGGEKIDEKTAEELRKLLEE